MMITLIAERIRLHSVLRYKMTLSHFYLSYLLSLCVDSQLLGDCERDERMRVVSVALRRHPLDLGLVEAQG